MAGSISPLLLVRFKNVAMPGAVIRAEGESQGSAVSIPPAMLIEVYSQRQLC